MAATLSSKISVKYTGTLANAGTLSTASVSLSHTYSLDMANGTAINQADKVYQARRSVTAATTDSIDLSGALIDPLGAAVVFAEIVGIIIENKSATAGEILTIGGNINPFSTWLGAAAHTIKIGPRGFFALCNPALEAYAVTAGTADMLDVNVAAGTAVSYDLLILGRSA